MDGHDIRIEGYDSVRDLADCVIVTEKTVMVLLWCVLSIPIAPECEA